MFRLRCQDYWIIIPCQLRHTTLIPQVRWNQFNRNKNWWRVVKSTIDIKPCSKSKFNLEKANTNLRNSDAKKRLGSFLLLGRPIQQTPISKRVSLVFTSYAKFCPTSSLIILLRVCKCEGFQRQSKVLIFKIKILIPSVQSNK